MQEDVLKSEGTHPQLLTKTARRCNLSEEQQAELRKVEKQIKPAELRSSKTARARSIYQVRTGIEAFLEPAQLEKYRSLMNPKAGGKRAGRPSRPGGGKPARDAKPKTETEGDDEP